MTELEIEKLSKNNQLIAGTRWEITESAVDYSSADYKLTYTFRNSSGVVKSFATTGDHLLTISAQDTSLLQGGYYTLVVSAVSLTDPTVIYPIKSAVIYVQGDINVSDSKSFYLKMVEKLETALLALADKTMDSVSIDGYTYNYKDIEKLEKMLDHYRSKAGIQSGRKRILIQFTNQ